jgi:2-oxoglutarate dehydrogenase E2 component (dihydrolipoamide succinyltransferase)
MTVAIKVPSVGESITEGTIARWLKKDGDFVREEEPLFELETEKATTPVPAPSSGTLHITAAEGQTVQIGAVVGEIDPAGKAPAAGDKKKRAEAARPEKEPAKAEAKAPAAAPAPAKPQGEPTLSPAARQLVADRGVDANAVPGTARGGRVTKEDVVNYLERQPAPPPGPAQAPPAAPPAAAPPGAPQARETRQRMSAIRQRIAERLVASQQSTATLTTFNEADMSAVLALRARYKDRFREKYEVNLGFMPFFVKACVAALQAYPAVNARIDGNEIVYQHFYNINIAVSTEQGLMVPVLRDADRLSFADIDKALAALAARAREGKISPSDITGGTFTITNGGVFGSLVSTPILNPPQSAILGMHAIQKRPVAVDDQVVLRPMMYLALSYDHRLIDGREAVLFLVRVKECVEAPERLLLEV